MEKSIFERMGGTYHKQGDYFMADLTAPEENNQPVGVWGQRNLRYIREHHRGLYVGLQLVGKLDSYLVSVKSLGVEKIRHFRAKALRWRTAFQL